MRRVVLAEHSSRTSRHSGTKFMQQEKKIEMRRVVLAEHSSRTSRHSGTKFMQQEIKNKLRRVVLAEHSSRTSRHSGTKFMQQEIKNKLRRVVLAKHTPPETRQRCSLRQPMLARALNKRAASLSLAAALLGGCLPKPTPDPHIITIWQP